MNATASRVAILCGAALATTSPSAAQQRSEPQLLLTIFGGAAAGGNLWSIDRQPLVLLEDEASIDTIALDRAITPGVSLGASATYFPSPHFGLSGEIVFLGFGRDDSCRFVYTDPSPARAGYNEQICADLTQTEGAASTFGFYIGGLYRVAPRGPVKPYLRALVGFTSRSSSTVEVTGRFTDGDGITRARLIILDPDPGAFTASAGFGAGVMIPFAAGYQARLEFRDNLVVMDRVTGPANALAVAPTDTRLLHSWALFFMLDIVLEQRRGRRY
jgi:hypothetical protein